MTLATTPIPLSILPPDPSPQPGRHRAQTFSHLIDLGHHHSIQVVLTEAGIALACTETPFLGVVARRAFVPVPDAAAVRLVGALQLALEQRGVTL